MATVRLMNQRLEVNAMETKARQARIKLNHETISSSKSFEILREKREQLERDEMQLLNLLTVGIYFSFKNQQHCRHNFFLPQENEKLRKKTQFLFEQDKLEMNKLNCLQNEVYYNQVSK